MSAEEALAQGPAVETAAAAAALAHARRPRAPVPLPGWADRSRADSFLEAAATAARQAPPEASTAVAWLLDNFHVARQVVLALPHDMPRAFWNRLPVPAATGETDDRRPGPQPVPRVLLLADAFLEATGLQLSVPLLTRFLRRYQETAPLRTAEIWALPTALRLAFLDQLAAALRTILPAVPPSPGRVVAPMLADPTEVVARALGALATLARLSWQDIFDTLSPVEVELARDPAGVYPAMTFDSRDRYRRAVEDLADWSGKEEHEVAAAAVASAMAQAHGVDHPVGHPVDHPVGHHVGHWLAGEGRAAFEAALGAVPPLRVRVRRFLARRARPLWLIALALATLVALLPPALLLSAGGASRWQWLLGLLLALLPAAQVAMAFVNWAVTMWVPPRVLPRLDLADGLPEGLETAVVMPVLVGDPAQAAGLATRLEAHFLANRDPGIAFVLLSDVPDAPAPVMPEDAAIEDALVAAIGQLNRRHGNAQGAGPFHLLHRHRSWCATQRAWLGRERKRGKLEDFNRLVLTGETGPFAVRAGETDRLRRCRYAMTVDADTRIPAGAVAALVGTLAHPLNRAVSDPATGAIRSGHAVLQPRVEPSPASGSASVYARLLSGDTTIDIYARAVSDVYQDLFGEGIFAGKGLYDIAAFHRSLEGRVPEERILSHDLFEGLHARAALVTDVTLFESHPASHAEQSARVHRWIRGDWQLLPWLGRRVPDASGRRVASRFGLIDRFKLFDNLRRSLVAPSLVMLALAGWLWLPGPPLGWSLLVAGALGLPILTEILTNLGRGLTKGGLRGLFRPLGPGLARFGLNLAFLLHDALIASDAILRTLWRLKSGRMLLAWQTAEAVRARQASAPARAQFRAMRTSVAVTAGILLLLLLLRPAALPAALVLLMAWLVAPLVAAATARNWQRSQPPLEEADLRFLRTVARRTWLFFETFVRAEHNWLPPDNFHESGLEEEVARTSPTNIGMMFLASLAAVRLGYLSIPALAERIQLALDALDQVDRHRGHLPNWIDTRTLRPLEPRYVSTVDSGNLAVSLVALAQGLDALRGSPLVAPSRFDGLADTLAILASTVADLEAAARGPLPALRPATERLAGLIESVLEVRDAPSRWPGFVRAAQAETFPGIGALLAEAAAAWRDADPGLLADLQAWYERAGAQLDQLALDTALEAEGPTDAPAELQSRLARLARRARAQAAAMDFSFLYDPTTRLFRIGFNLSAGELDRNCYDLLASEARLASYFAIAKGDVPVAHWWHLGRPVVRDGNRVVLVSWQGSMFEYLMPRLLLDPPAGSLLAEAEQAAVSAQIAHGRQLGLPWGISESGFAARDVSGHYHYRGLGVPRLGLRRGLEEDQVIAPYATLLALPVAPRAAVSNLEALAGLGLLRRYGFVEAVDFTPSRVPAGRRFVAVAEYMAHHQGMALAALANSLGDNWLARLFHADPEMAVMDLLLAERCPWNAGTEALGPPPAVRGEEAPPAPALASWPAPEGLPLLHLNGNGRLAQRHGGRGSVSLWFEDNLVARTPGTGTAAQSLLPLMLQEAARGMVWRPGAAAADLGEMQADGWSATLFPHGATYRDRAHGLAFSMEAGIAADQDLECLRIGLTNETGEPRDIDLLFLREIILNRAADHERHPAFSRMFIETRWIAERQALLARRRPRRPDERFPVMLTRIVCDDPGFRLIGHETDRARLFAGPFPAQADVVPPSIAGMALSGTTGFTLDPVAALGARLLLPANGRIDLAILTAVAPTLAAAEALLDRCQTVEAVDWELRSTATTTATELSRRGFRHDEPRALQALLARLLQPMPQLDPPAGALSPAPGQQDLWAAGISGDHPLMALRCPDGQVTPLSASLLRLHRRAKELGARVDLVLLYGGEQGYSEPVRERLLQQIRDAGSLDLLGHRGGLHLVPLELSGLVEAVMAAALLVLDSDRSSVMDALPPPPRLPDLPRFHPMGEPAPELPGTSPDHPPLLLHNGHGGFEPQTGAYVLDAAPPPIPWSNVLSNPQFGTLVDDRGLGFTWAINSGEFRLTPWRNDPVFSPPVEALYLRDEVTAQIWTPVPEAGEGRVCHRPGESAYVRTDQGLTQDMTVAVAPDAPVKIVRLRLTNRTTAPRRITATYFADWLLGPIAGETEAWLSSAWDPESGAILARNRRVGDFADMTAFLTSDCPPHGLSVARAAFLGPMGDRTCPLALTRWGLGSVLSSRGDCCGAYQVHLDIAPLGVAEATFLLGAGGSQDEARALARRFRAPGAGARAQDEVRAFWDGLLAAVEVSTPDPAFDLMVNRWLPAQALAARLFARAGPSQASGAFGFRDQLQDVIALLWHDPTRARRHILEAAAHQFVEGDVLHWWHPPGGQGVRTRCSDDLLWLPWAAAAYVEATGDIAILDEEVPYLVGAPLAPGERERYGSWAAAEPAPLLDHLARALAAGWQLGPDGLPLIGTGDWNDGLDRVGEAGRGTSIWLGWFLIAVIDGFVALARKVGRDDLAAPWPERREALRQAIEAAGWDGAWYLRAIDDAGHPWGSAGNEACRIDLIAQAWAVLSGAADPARARQAIAEARTRLAGDEDDLVRLLAPPFGAGRRDPGYIAAYPPGIRENGGQYSHAAAWFGMALARLGHGDGAKAVFDRINPIRRSADPAAAARYRTEPYVCAADIGGAPPHEGRGGWTWYTGAAGWTFRLALEAILGLRLIDGRLAVAPVLPADWREATVVVRRGAGAIRVLVRGGGCGPWQVTSQGREVTMPVAFPAEGEILLEVIPAATARAPAAGLAR
ncbi:GH36-type glycosyl hydrolase domain-containing protein [Thermaurantiacus sp.]